MQGQAALRRRHLGLCAKCGMSLKMSKALKFYTANIRLSNDHKPVDAKAFHDTICNILSDCAADYDARQLEQELLKSPPMTFQLDRKNTVYSVRRL